jgi:hypothetical protein
MAAGLLLQLRERPLKAVEWPRTLQWERHMMKTRSSQFDANVKEVDQQQQQQHP